MHPSIRTWTSKWVATCLVVAFTQTATARITQNRASPSETWGTGLPLVIGGGFEYEGNNDQGLYDFPLLLEYSVSERLKFNVEPTVSYLESRSEDVRSVAGLGDLETSVQWEFISERRYRPAVTAEGLVKWPTASHTDLGTRGHDYRAGLLFSKDLAFIDLDLDFNYTWVADPGEQDLLEIALSSEYPVINHLVSVIAEVVHTVGTGASLGTTHQTEGTLGLAWQVNRFLKLEFGYSLKNDLRGQFVTAWEWNFEGDD